MLNYIEGYGNDFFFGELEHLNENITWRSTHTQLRYVSRLFM